MNKYLEKAIPLTDNKIRSKFESIWNEVTDSPTPKYRILIWGSVAINRGRKPRDLDIMIEYTGKSIQPEKEKSIEGWLHNEINCDEFSYVDPLVIHHFETPDVISRSRISKVYSVDEEGWLEFN